MEIARRSTAGRIVGNKTGDRKRHRARRHRRHRRPAAALPGRADSSRWIRTSWKGVSHEPLAHLHRAPGHDGARLVSPFCCSASSRSARCRWRRCRASTTRPFRCSAVVPGANPETMASSVATPLEREFSTIAGIESMNSSNSQGSTHDHHSVHARPQDRRRRAGHPGRDLEGRRPPAASMPRPPSYQKVNPAEQPILYLALESDTLPMYTVNEYADTLLAQRISMVSGVSRVQVFGAQKYAVRVQVDPDELAARSIGIDEVQRAISDEQHQSSHRPAGWRQAGVHHPIQRHRCRTRPPTGPSSSPGATASPVRLEQLANVIDSVDNDKIVGLVQQQARRHPRDSAAARHQHRGGGRQHPALLPEFRARDSARRSIWRSRSTRRNRFAARSTTSSSRWC